MGYALRADLHVGRVGDRFIFLDLPADRYVATSAGLSNALDRLMDGPSPVNEPLPALQPLVEQGWLIWTRSDAAPVLPHHTSASGMVSRLEGPAVRPSSMRRMSALADLGRSILSDRRATLYRRSIDYRRLLARRGTPSPPSSDDACADVVAAFAWAARFLSVHDRCVPRSFALARRLVLCGVTPQLVIGVALRPFAAHCWVQHGSTVLNDQLDHIRCFSPILVL